MEILVQAVRDDLPWHPLTAQGDHTTATEAHSWSHTAQRKALESPILKHNLRQVRGTPSLLWVLDVIGLAMPAKLATAQAPMETAGRSTRIECDLCLGDGSTQQSGRAARKCLPRASKRSQSGSRFIC